MPIKKVFTSEKVVYRPEINERIQWLNGMSVVRNPDNSTELKIHLHVVTQWSTFPGWGVGVYQFSALTGAFESFRTDVNISLLVKQIVTDFSGAIWGWSQNLNFVKLNPQTATWDSTGKGFNFFGANVGTSRVSGSPYMINLLEDRFVTRLGADSAYSVSICEYSSGDFLYRVNVCGRPVALFAVDASRAYAIADDGTVTVFNFVTGEVQGAFHSGIEQNIGNQAWTWDPQLRRILHCPYVADTFTTEYVCNVLINGYYPVPLALGMTPPIPLNPPREGVTVPVYCRVYGGAGEGIPGQEVTFTVTDTLGASVAPNRRNTAENGVVKTFLTGALAGANGITAETEVPDA